MLVIGYPFFMPLVFVASASRIKKNNVASDTYLYIYILFSRYHQHNLQKNNSGFSSLVACYHPSCEFESQNNATFSKVPNSLFKSCATC